MTTIPSREFKFAVGGYRADIMESKSGSRKWYVVVQKKDSHDIVAIDRFESYEEAREAVTDTLERLNAAAGA